MNRPNESILYNESNFLTARTFICRKTDAERWEEPSQKNNRALWFALLHSLWWARARLDHLLDIVYTPSPLPLQKQSRMPDALSSTVR